MQIKFPCTFSTSLLTSKSISWSLKSLLNNKTYERILSKFLFMSFFLWSTSWDFSVGSWITFDFKDTKTAIAIYCYFDIILLFSSTITIVDMIIIRSFLLLCSSTTFCPTPLQFYFLFLLASSTHHFPIYKIGKNIFVVRYFQFIILRSGKPTASRSSHAC